MRKRIVVIILAVAAAGALALAPLVLAETRGERGYGFGMHGVAGKHGGPGAGAMHGLGLLGPLMHLGNELDLTEAQEAEIKAIFEGLREKNAPYREQLHGGLKDAAKLLLANPQDTAGARVLLEKQAAAERAAKENALEAASQALGVLNAGQRAKLGQFLEEQGERFARRHRRAS